MSQPFILGADDDQTKAQQAHAAYLATKKKKNDNKTNHPPKEHNGGITPQTGKQRSQFHPIYDGNGNQKTPYSTSKQFINRRYITFHAHFYTQEGEYDASYALGRTDNPNNTSNDKERETTGELCGFQTVNDIQKDTPVMQLTLFAEREWEQVLMINDFVTLRVEITSPDKKESDYPMTTLMSGLISDINWSESTDQGRIYTITCSGIQQVLENVTLSLPNVAAQNNAFLLYDINGNSNAANEDFTASGSNSGGGSTASGGQAAAAVWNYFHKKGYNDKQCAGILGNVEAESSFNPTVTEAGGGGGLGLFQSTPGSKMTNYCKAHHLNWKKPQSQCEWFYSAESSGFAQYKKQTGSPSSCAEWFCTNIERAGTPNMSRRTSSAEKYYKKYHK